MENSDFYKKMLENIYEGVYFVDTARQISFWNKGAERISGFSSEEVIGKHCFNNILNHVDDTGKKLCMLGCPLHQTILTGTMSEAGVYLHHKDGYRVPVSIRAMAIYEGDKIVGAVEVFTDDSQKHDAIKDIEAYKILAMRDQLTGLPNRRNIDTFFEAKMNEYKTFGLPFGIIFIDIDKFKVFNDTYGHDLGDKVLKMVAKTCQNVNRTTDLLGRFGGEEFVGILAGIDEKMLIKKAEEMRMLVESSVLRIENEMLSVTISIGATMIRPEDTIESLLKRADKLLYKSKENGRNQVSFE